LSAERYQFMKIAGFLLLVAGWLLALAPVVLLRTGPPQVVFILAGIAVQALALGLVFRSHLIPHGRHE
jgi:hypothetical protein